MSVFNSSCYWHCFKDFVVGHLGLPGYPPGVANQHIPNPKMMHFWVDDDFPKTSQFGGIMWVPLEDTWEVKCISFLPSSVVKTVNSATEKTQQLEWMEPEKIMEVSKVLFCSSHFAEAEFLDAMVQLQGCIYIYSIHFFRLSMMYFVWYPSFFGSSIFWERRSWKSVWNTCVSRKHVGWWGECQGYLQLHMYWSICQVPEVFSHIPSLKQWVYTWKLMLGR